jgi:hypothetical protein
VSSYTKQMIGVAADWLAANKDPDDPFLRIPAFMKARSRHADTTEAELARYEREASRRPDLRPHVDELKGLVKQIREIEDDTRVREDVVEQVLNKALVPRQEKLTVNDLYNAHIGRWSLAWARHGYNVFDLSADFTAAMLLTDARGLDISDVRLPFRGLLMIVPPGFARGVEGSDYTKIHLTEIPRTDLTQLDVANEVAEIIKSAQDDGMPPAQVREFLAGVEERAAKSTPSLLQHKPDPDDTAIHIYATDGAHALDTLIERKGLAWDSFDDLPDSVCCDEDKRARQTLRQIVFGTLAYISAVEHAVERNAVDAPRKQRKASAEPSAQRWTVGRTIRIAPELVRAARAGSREVALRMKHRHIVRGHYRNQPFGTGRSERRRQWIAPFWKGPADGAALVHTYRLETKDQP